MNNEGISITPEDRKKIDELRELVADEVKF